MKQGVQRELHPSRERQFIDLVITNCNVELTIPMNDIISDHATLCIGTGTGLLKNC